MPLWDILGSSQCHQVKSRGRVQELKKGKRGTRGTRAAEQEHMRGTTEGQKMYSRGTKDEQQRYSRRTREALRIHNTIIFMGTTPSAFLHCVGIAVRIFCKI